MVIQLVFPLTSLRNPAAHFSTYRYLAQFESSSVSFVQTKLIPLLSREACIEVILLSEGLLSSFLSQHIDTYAYLYIAW